MSLESAAVARSSEMTGEERKVLVATLVGTTIEWYDFFVYAQATGLVFASLFFAPMNQNNPLLAQIVSFATLGLSFLFRPLGAIVCGSLGDRFGRKNVLVATLVLMGAATALVGVCCRPIRRSARWRRRCSSSCASCRDFPPAANGAARR